MRGKNKGLHNRARSRDSDGGKRKGIADREGQVIKKDLLAMHRRRVIMRDNSLLPYKVSLEEGKVNLPVFPLLSFRGGIHSLFWPSE